MKQKFWLMWTYIGNYSSTPYEVTAEPPQAAASQLLTGFSDDFRKKGTVFVYTAPPVLVSTRESRAAQAAADKEA